MLALFLTVAFASGAMSSLLCPAMFNSAETVHLPHPTVCSKFLTCVGSAPVEQACPQGLHWNEQTSRCDYPGPARCSRDGVPEGRNYNSTTAANSICLPQTNRCPLNPDPTEQVVFLRHRDCSKFYACVSAQPVELSCPPKLYWNSQSCTCDYEVDDDCDHFGFRNEEDQEDQENQDQQPEQEPAETEDDDASEHEPEQAAETEEEPQVDASEPETEPVVENVRRRRSVQARQDEEATTAAAAVTATTEPHQSGATHVFSSIFVLILAAIISSS